MLFIRMNPLTPKVLGKAYDTPCQKPEMLLNGQLRPQRNSIGNDVNTTMSMTLSRYLTKELTVIAKNTHASRYGTRKWNRVGP